MRDDFAIFIVTHGRPDKQLTLETILRCGYTGKWFLIVDDTDVTIQQYIDNFGSNNIIVFNKNYYINSSRFDNVDNKLHDKGAVYARRAVEDIAKQFNYSYFLMADDDISNLILRVPINNKLRRISITNLDKLLDCHIDWFTDSVAVIGFGNPAYYFGGINLFSEKNLSTRLIPIQFIIRNANVPVDWVSWFAEDDISGYQNSINYLWLTSYFIMIEGRPVGDVTGIGGSAETYKEFPNKYYFQFNGIKCCPQRLLLKYRRKLKTFEFDRHTDRSFSKIISEVYKK